MIMKSLRKAFILIFTCLFLVTVGTCHGQNPRRISNTSADIPDFKLADIPDKDNSPERATNGLDSNDPPKIAATNGTINLDLENSAGRLATTDLNPLVSEAGTEEGGKHSQRGGSQPSGKL